MAKRKREKDDGKCQVCWENARADPAIWLTECIEGKTIDRLICLDCAVMEAKQWASSIQTPEAEDDYEDEFATE